MRTISITGKSSGWGASSKAIDSAKGNADYKAGEALKENEIIIKKIYDNAYCNGSDGIAQTTYTVGTLEEEMLYKQNEIALKIEEVRLIDFERELELDVDNKHLLLNLVDKHGIDKMTDLLKIFRDVERPLTEKEVRENKPKKYIGISREKD